MKDILLLLSKYFYYKPVELRKILTGFSDLEKVLTAPKDAFLKLGAGGKALDEFIKSRNQESKKEINKEDIKIVTIFDEKYPAALKNIYDPPSILFYKGDLDVLKNNCLAVIGSRKASEYGRRVAEFFVRDLSPHFVIVSGLAYGIDSLAHELAIKGGGKAVAVLGSGLDDKNIYPRSNLNLAKKIIETGGLLLSEIPPGAGPQQFHFPMRNRIIAGLSRGILIAEAGEKSGTLITAKLGLEYGVDIFSVPGSVFSPTSAGVNFLIKCGAHPVTSAKEILEFYGVEIEQGKENYVPKSDLERLVLENLGADSRRTDELARLTKTPVTDLIGALTDLEMAGVIRNIGGSYAKI